MNRVGVIQLVDGFATEEHSGGAAQFAIQLARHLDQRRFAVHVVALWRYNTRSEQRWLQALAAEGIGTHILVEQPTRLGNDLMRAVVLLNGVIERTGARVVNSHFERGDVLAMAAKLRRPSIRIVRTQHTDQQWQKRPWMGTLLNTAAFPWLFNAEVAISAATRTAMDSRFTARMLGRSAKLIYNGLSPAALATFAQERRHVGLLGGGPRLVLVGRLAPQKGHRDALAALQLIRQHIPMAELLMVGEGELRGELERMTVELGLTSHVQFVGQREDIPQLLAQSDVLISPSLWEGFPTVILEAMAAGVPVVATNVSGSRELVRNGVTGMLVPVNQPQALADAIMQLFRQPEMAHKFALQAQLEVQHYRFDTIAEEYAELYDMFL